MASEYYHHVYNTAPSTTTHYDPVHASAEEQQHQHQYSPYSQSSHQHQSHHHYPSHSPSHSLSYSHSHELSQPPQPPQPPPSQNNYDFNAHLPPQSLGHSHYHLNNSTMTAEPSPQHHQSSSGLSSPPPQQSPPPKPKVTRRRRGAAKAEPVEEPREPQQADSSSASPQQQASSTGSSSDKAPRQVNIKTKFPVARIKRIMQADEDVGKVAQVTPVVVSKALELFMIQLCDKASEQARQRHSKRITAGHLKQAILHEEQFDFLADIIEKVPDIPLPSENSNLNGEGSEDGAPAKKPRKPRARKASVKDEEAH
ncbi:histone-fold-containing protein [Pyronema domesticum]|uniref:NCT transcriptional regulatory complex subunit A n=1 Tax=Pyronema omphalodes (strain CBS 100304) TaxID=1076935 RepID=U4LAU6_PYROM|nr:histone-fold-containing protein [Pyronema domesticum]CCX07284.1 Similar to DNA polymerase epsilon subunit C; acc. no. Q6C6M5 [Pyronema omphalodes CBS 100304]